MFFPRCTTFLLALSCLLAAPPAAAQEEEKLLRTNADDCLARMPAGEAPEQRPWREVAGRYVVVEGIAWGKREKGYPEVLVGEARIRVEMHDEKKDEAWEDGRLVRIEGHLSRGGWGAYPRRRGGVLAETYLEEVVYYVSVRKWEFLPKVGFPGIQVLPLEPRESKHLPGIEQDDRRLAAPAGGAVADAKTWREAIDHRVVVEGTVRRIEGAENIGVDAVEAGGERLVVELPPRARKGWEEGRQVRIEGILVRFVVSSDPRYDGAKNEYRWRKEDGVYYFLSAARWEPVAKVEIPGVRLAPPRTKALEPAVAARSPHDYPVVVQERGRSIVKTWSEAVGCIVTMTGESSRSIPGRIYPGWGGPYLRVYQKGFPGLEIDVSPTGAGGEPAWNQRFEFMGRATGRLERHIALPGKAGRFPAREGGPGTYYVLAIDNFERLDQQNLTAEEAESRRAVHDIYPKREGEPRRAFQDAYPVQTPEGEKPVAQTWKDAVGRRVVVEGAAGYLHGKGEVQITFNDDDFFPDAPVNTKHLDFRMPDGAERGWREHAPVRIEGILHRYVVDEPPPPPPGAPLTVGVQSPGYGVNYYLETTRVEFIPKLELPGMRLAPARPHDPKSAAEKGATLAPPAVPSPPNEK